MSWSSPSPLPRASFNPRVLLAALALGLGQAPGFAAEVYQQPAASLTVEGDTNLDVDPGERTRTEGNLASVSDLIGITTPDSDSAVRPRIEYRDYPSDHSDDRLEGYLDFNSSARWQRSNASVYGSLEHLDEFNAELPSALYDSYFPGSPTQPETGRSVAGATRDSVYVVPNYNFRYSPVMGLNVSGTYQHINYSPNDAVAHIDFNFYLAKAALSYSLSQRTDLSVGAFGSRYEATRIESHATGSGGVLDLSTSWTPIFSTSLSVVYEHVNFDEDLPAGTPTAAAPTSITPTATAQPTIINSTANAWGATVDASYKTLVSQYRLDGGRLITPSGGGALYVNDQIKSQYDRELSTRWSITGAILAIRNRGLTTNVAGNDRTYLQTVVETKWMLTPTWFIQGGLQYMWQKYELDLSGAADTRVYIRVGYKGLPPQR